MANPSMTEEEIQFRRRAKHRLIGAVALVSGLVVFLPMVLDNEPKPVAEDIAINIPSQDAKPAKVAVAAPPVQAPRAALPTPPAEDAKPETPPPVQPLTVLPGGQAPKLASVETPHAELAKNPKAVAAPAETAKNAATPAVQAKPEKPAETAPELVKPAASKESKQAGTAVAEKAKSAPEKPKSAAEKAKPDAHDSAVPSQSGFVVRLGAFAKPENAKQLKAKLTSMGIRNYSDVLKTATGDKHRVRAGPYATKREAEAVRERLKAVDFVGDVVPKP